MGGGPLDLPGAGTASFVWAGHHVSEAGGSARLEVVRRGGTAGTLTVDYYTLDREAREGVDYTARSGTLTFGPGEVLHEIEIPIADNATIEGARSFYVVLGAEPAAGLRPSVIVTIEDDARPGHLAWETEPAAVREGAGAITLKVRRTLGTEGRSTVQFETADGSAKAGADFAATTGTLIFEDGVTEQTVAIPIATDGVNEGDEVFFISLGGGAGGASLDPVPSALVTIYDIDDPGSFAGTAGLGVNPHIDALVAQRDGKVVVAGTFTVAPGTVDAPHAVVRLNADGQLDPTFTIFHYAGFAQSMAVYTDGTLILAGQSLTLERASFVRLASDGTLDAAFHPPTPGPNGPVYGVGAQPDGRIVFAGVFGTVGGVPRRFLARLLADGTLDPTFQPTVASGIRKMIVAPDGSIYHGAPNTRVAHLRADGTADPAWEMPTIPTSAANQPTCLQLDADGRLLVGGSFEGVNGVPRASLVRLLPTGRVDPTFKPSAVLTSAVEAIALQADGGILAAFFDYRSRGGLLRLEPTGAHDPTFDLPPGQPNGQGRFTALAVLPAAGLLVGGDFFEIDRVAQEDTALLLLGPQRGAFRFPPGTGDLVREGTTSFAVSVQRIGSTQGRASVRYETLPGKALSGEDFTPVSGTLTFEDGESAHTIPIAITDDFAYEQAEAFSVQLSEAEGAQLWPSDRTRFVTIQDNDLPQRGVLHFSTDAITVSEDAGVVRLRIERSHGSDGDATVSLAIAPRTGKNVAAAGSDFSLTTAAVTFLDGQTSRAFDIPISRDGKFEPAEQFVITLSPPAFPPMLELPPTVTVTILDGDQPAIEATRGRYRALVESPTGSWNSSGLVDFTVGARGAVTGTLALEGRRWSWRGELDARRRLELLLPRAGQEPLILQLDVDLTDPEHPRITGSVDHDFVSSTFDAARQTFHAARNPAPAAGRYTLAFAPGTGDHAPAGHGFALVSVNKGGRVWMSGKLGDGTPFTHGSMLGHDGGWAIFLPLSTRRGTFRGEVRLSAALPWDVAGEATWYKPASATDFGWDTPIVIAGSALPATAPLFPAAAAVQVTLTGGGLPQPVVSAPLARPRATTLTGPLALTLTLQPATGLFTGRFQHPATQRSTRVQGVILSDENRGAGCFSGPASAGAVELQTAPAP